MNDNKNVVVINKMLFSISGDLSTEEVFEEIEEKKFCVINKSFKSFKEFYTNYLIQYVNWEREGISVRDTNRYFEDTIYYCVIKINNYFIVIIEDEDTIKRGYGLYCGNILIYTEYYYTEYLEQEKKIFENIKEIMGE